MITPELYILYGFLAFISLLLVTLIGIQLRQSFTIGRMQGQLDGLTERLNGLAERLNGLEARIERLEDQMASLRAEVAEIRGMLLGLNSRMDLLMRHHHDEAGRVVIVPAEEVAAD